MFFYILRSGEIQRDNQLSLSLQFHSFGSCRQTHILTRTVLSLRVGRRLRRKKKEKKNKRLLEHLVIHLDGDVVSIIRIYCFNAMLYESDLFSSVIIIRPLCTFKSSVNVCVCVCVCLWVQQSPNHLS